MFFCVRNLLFHFGRLVVGLFVNSGFIEDLLKAGFARALKVLEIAVSAGKSLKFLANFIQLRFYSALYENICYWQKRSNT